MLVTDPVSLRRGERSSPKCWTFFTSDRKDNTAPMNEEQEQNLPLEEYVQEAKKCMEDMDAANDQEAEYKHATSYIRGYIDKMFVDMSAPYSVRLSELQSFLKLDEEHAHDMLQRCLAHTFLLLYSSLESIPKGLVILLWFVIRSMSIASVVLFASSNKAGYNKNDVRVTYILFGGNALMDFIPFILGLLYSPFQPCHKAHFGKWWHDMVSQFSFMSFCVRKKKPTVLMKLAIFSCLRQYVNMNCYIRQEPLARQITGLVHRYIRDGWKDISDAAGYKKFNRRLVCLGRVSEVPFDHMVLL
ncbi:hypothetical protein ZWY2020_012906 [Hordeum vulgare]|nr:hypothetical protein ZWY2020_012906 [Hordeum vulgare]